MRRRWLGVVFALYLAGVGYGVFGPNPGDHIERAAHRAQRTEAQVRSGLNGSDGDDDGRGATPDLVPDLKAEEMANIAMFVPFGLLFPAWWPRRRWWTVAVAAAVSAAIELTQWAFLSWRSPSLGDVRWNTVGAACGFALWLAARALLDASRVRRHPDTQPGA